MRKDLDEKHLTGRYLFPACVRTAEPLSIYTEDVVQDMLG